MPFASNRRKCNYSRYGTIYYRVGTCIRHLYLITSLTLPTERCPGDVLLLSHDLGYGAPDADLYPYRIQQASHDCGKILSIRRRICEPKSDSFALTNLLNKFDKVVSVREQQQTEALIKEKARVLFFQKGFLNATTQEIADEAGVNRALIHYYFRSREQLLDTLLEEVVTEKRERVRAIFSSDRPFRHKIALYIEKVIDVGMAYPYLENFIISETARDPEKTRIFCSKDKQRSAVLIRQQLQEEIDAGRMQPIPTEHFMVNLVSMCNYPLLAKNVLQSVHGMSDTTYRKFLQERKRMIYCTIFNEEMPEGIS